MLRKNDNSALSSSGFFNKNLQEKLSKDAQELMDLEVKSPSNMETTFSTIYNASPEALFESVNDVRTLIQGARTSPAAYALYSNNTRAINLIQSLVSSDSNMASQFAELKKNIKPNPAYILSQHTWDADYEKMKELANSSPESIVTRVWCGQNQILINPVQHEGSLMHPEYTFRENKFQSPFELACYSYDSIAIQIYFDAIKNHAPHLLNELQSQMQSQHEHYDIEPLLQPYRDYVKLVLEHKNEESIEISLIEQGDSLIHSISSFQKNLPRHFLLEIFKPYYYPKSINLCITEFVNGKKVVFSEKRPWDEAADFCYENNTYPTLQYISAQGEGLPCFDASPLLAFLGHPSLQGCVIRGDQIWGAQLGGEPYQGDINQDCTLFSKLYNVRKSEFNALAQRLELEITAIKPK